MSSDSSKFYESVNGAVSIEGEVTKNYQKHMEAHGPLDSNDGPRRYPLTPVRVVRGVLCILVLVSTAFMILVYLAPVLAGILRLFSIHYSRKAVSFVFGTWLSLWPFFFEKINQTKVIFAGEVLPARERALLLANHRTEVDWMYLWDLALRKGRLGYIKYILKSSLMQLPIFGWGFHILEFIPVERKWELDESNMYHTLSTFSDPQDPLWLALFPEGTDFSEQKCIKGQQYATKNGLPILKNLLLPKTKGFHACLEVLRGSLDADADPTDGFTPVNLTEDNFEIQKPYNMPLNSRYSYKDGVRKLWVFSDDMPFSPGSGTKPRTEIRINGLDYSSGVWQFEGYTLVPQGTSAVSIVQIHGITEATTCLQLRIYNGALDFFNYNTLATNIYNKWMRLNVIHDADERNIIVYMDGEKKYEAKDHGPGTFYFKCGVYGQDGMSHKMESQWRNIKIYKK